MRVVGGELGAVRREQARELARDVPEGDQADAPAGQADRHARLRPVEPAAADDAVGGYKMARAGEDQRERVRRHVGHVRERHADDFDVAGARGVQVDPVGTDAVADRADAARRVEQGGRDRLAAGVEQDVAGHRLGAEALVGDDLERPAERPAGLLLRPVGRELGG